MAKATKYASYHTAIDTGYTNPANAYANDSNYATAAPGKNTVVSAYWGFAAFGTGDIPNGATINYIVFRHVFKVSTTSSVANEYIQGFIDTTAQGTEAGNTNEPTSDTELSHQVNSGITLTDLRTADKVRARTRSHQGNSSTAVTFSIKYVEIEVDYTEAGTAHEKNLDDTITFSDDRTPQQGHQRTLEDTVTFSDDRSFQLAGSWAGRPILKSDGTWHKRVVKVYSGGQWIRRFIKKNS